jgi:type IV pilus assembly protein PilC
MSTTGWKYRARTPDGETRTGLLQAVSEDDARRALVRDKLIPEWVKPAPLDRSFRLRRRPNVQALAIFTRQLATLVDAAVPLVASLEIAQGLTEDRTLGIAIRQVSVDIQAGSTLADAMRRHPRVFSHVYVSMVEAGELGGELDQILLRLADYLEKSQELSSRIKTALIYPAVILFVAVAAVAIMLAFIVPTFEEMFATAGLTLPYPTLVLVGVSEFLVQTWLFLVVGALALFLLIRQLYETAAIRRVADALALRLPLFGGIVRKAAVARFSRTVSSLLSSGVNLLDALEAAARGAGNARIEQGIVSSRKRIEAGQGISGPLSASGVLPNLVARMVQVGEESGRLDDMLDKVAVFFEDEVDSAVERLMKSLEPGLVVFVGAILGAMVVAMYLPIFQALTSVG